MTFLVRQIARTADGREIVRPARFDAAEIAIGRSSDCEVHLADLAVEARHAVARETGPGRIEVKAVGGLGFRVDGRSTTHAQIDAAQGAELRFGSHRLTVGREGENVTIAVERVEAVSDSAEDRDWSSVFTLRGLLPGKRVSAWGFVVLMLAAFLAWPIYSYATWRDAEKRPAGYHGDEAWMSGSLSLAHANLENNCQACHTKPFVAVRDVDCVACHKDDSHAHADPLRLANAKAPPTLTGKAQLVFANAFNVPPGRCVDCHTEHEGGGRMQPTAQRFCADCHATLDDRLTDTQLDNASDFGLDHPQFKPALLIRSGGRNPPTQRVSLDRRPQEDNGLKFPHALHLSKTGGVARMAQRLSGDFGFGQSLACKDCHTPDPSGVRFRPVDMESDCAMCHSLTFDIVDGTRRTLRHGEPRQVVADLRAFYRSTGPKRPIALGGQARRRPGDAAQQGLAGDYAFAARTRFARADEAIRAVFSRGGACYDCHSVEQSPRGSLAFDIRPVSQPMRYFHKGWFDHDAHKQETCESCHTGAVKSASARDLLLPDLTSCRTCHVGESGASLVKVSKPTRSGCALCHSYHADDGAPWLVRQRIARQKRVEGTPLTLGFRQ